MTCEGTGGRLEEFDSRLLEVEAKVSEFGKLQEGVSCLQSDLPSTKRLLSSYEQRSRLKGVPMKKDENLYSIIDAIGRKVNYICPKAQVNYISRVPVFNSSDKLIIVSLNRYVK